MSLRTLRMKICKVIKQRKADIVLWLIIEGSVIRELYADSDNQELDWLGIGDGSSIVFTVKT
jgi:tubulin-specific chaperone E